MTKTTRYSADVQTIANKFQRYRTCGDWFTADNGLLKIRVSNTNNRKYAFLTALHEMIEQFLCECSGITEDQVDSWDLLHEDQDEPGEMLKCPYREQHLFAEAMEKVIAEKIGVDWVEYGKALEAAMDEKLKKPEPYIANTNLSINIRILETKRILEEQEG